MSQPAIQILEHNRIDKSKWDACVLASTNPLPYAMSSHLDTVSPQWNALVAGDYDAVLPLTHRNKFGIAYLHQPYFTQQLGCFSHQPVSVDLAQAFVNELTWRYRFAEIHFHSGCEAFTHTTSSKSKWLPRRTHHIDLNQPYENIAAQYNDQRKRGLKKALQHGLVVREERDGDWLREMFHENKQGILETGDFNLLKHLMDVTLRNGLVYAVYENDRRVAGAFMLCNARYVINLFNISNDRGKETQAMTLLIDHALKQHADTNRVFDFEGSQIESISKFYAGFGATPVTYWMFRHDALPWPLSFLKRLKNGSQPG